MSSSKNKAATVADTSSSVRITNAGSSSTTAAYNNSTLSFNGSTSSAVTAKEDSPKPATAEKPEDESEYLSVDTFGAYQPTALPDVVVEACNQAGGSPSTGPNDSIQKRDTVKKPIVVNLIDDDDEDGKDEQDRDKNSEKDKENQVNDKMNTTKDNDDKNNDDENHDDDSDNKKVPLKLMVPAHTSPACESALLSSVAAPKVHPDTAVALMELAQQGALSPLQLEGVLSAIQRHRRILHDGRRSGFFIGDGAGVGKGRQCASIIRDAMLRNISGRRHLWLSVSRELVQDARRDLTDVGITCDVFDGTELLDKKGGALGGKPNDKGVLFLTYNLLISDKRCEQIINWATNYNSQTMTAAEKEKKEKSYAGVICFDEAHRAKNLSDNTKTAKLVLTLQRRLPRARIVYVSATGVSDLEQLAYAERLGLWGIAKKGEEQGSAYNGSYYFPHFQAFKNSLSSKGMSALEILALELKQQGSFLARTLSWDGTEFETMQVTLTAAQEAVYDQAVQFWNRCNASLKQALAKIKQVTASDGRELAIVWRIFWNAHQRFFKELAICAKVPSLAQDARKQIERGNCVVIGLQTTGDANLQTMLGNDGNDGGKKNGKRSKAARYEESPTFDSLLSTVSASVKTFLISHFPVATPPPVAPQLPSNEPTTEQQQAEYARVQAEIARIEALPDPEPIPELVRLRDTLLEGAEELELPPNPLDDLIDRLGGVDEVAEMTGRPGRIVRDKKRNNSFVYSKRGQDESERVNLAERRKFMDGAKAVAIISDAASTGISLHAAHGSNASHKRRIHYTLELPWSADKAVQQLGRSHRAGQESAPIYQLVVTNLGGERRFAAAVSKRMASLGALTKGDRRAATGSDMLSEFDLDSKYGKRALKRLYSALDNHQLEEQVRQSRQQTGVDLPEAAVQSGFPSLNSREILDSFVHEITQVRDPLVASLPSDSARKHSFLMSFAASELDEIGLDQEARAKQDVRIFLNRLAGLKVKRQTLVFGLFMSTLQDVIKEAKSTGEYEGTAEDIRATTIKIKNELDLAQDPASGATTKLTTLVLDRGVSFESVCQMALDEARKLTEPDKMSTEDGRTEGGDDNEEEDDDAWLSTNEQTIAKPGFYISRKQIAGRKLIIFARCKFDHSAFESEEEAENFDPLGLMCICRPNTGISASDIATGKLMNKYRPLLSCEEMKRGLSAADVGDDVAMSAVELVEQGNDKVSKMWEQAFAQSNSDTHNNGLAPRRQLVKLVTGPALHVLPLLEKAVSTLGEKDRALKIMRADVDGRRLVGVRFPLAQGALEKLQVQLNVVKVERAKAGEAYNDEALVPVCEKSLDWATTKKRKISAFFAPKSSVPPASSLGKNAAKQTATNGSGKKAAKFKASGGKRSSPSLSSTSRKKSKSLDSFFKK